MAILVAELQVQLELAVLIMFVVILEPLPRLYELFVTMVLIKQHFSQIATAVRELQVRVARSLFEVK